MSTHECPVVKVVLETHPNADSLSVVHVFKYPVVVRTEDWIGVDLGVYIPPDSLVPADHPLFSWLPHKEGETQIRVKARRFRGISSQGILIPLRDVVATLWISHPGENLAGLLGVEHYEPEIRMDTGGDSEPRGPSGVYPKYDVENFNRYGEVFTEEDRVVVTEKIHGANSRFMWDGEEMWVGSRTQWKVKSSANLWWRALEQNMWISGWCRQHRGYCLYGETFGQVQNLKYGAKKGQLFVAIFDVLTPKGEWLSWVQLGDWRYRLCWVPRLYLGHFHEGDIRQLAEGSSSWPGADHMREGVVIRMHRTEEWCPEIGKGGGRKQLKIVSNRYLEKS